MEMGVVCVVDDEELQTAPPRRRMLACSRPLIRHLLAAGSKQPRSARQGPERRNQSEPTAVSGAPSLCAPDH